jgi:hypothetical protein
LSKQVSWLTHWCALLTLPILCRATDLNGSVLDDMGKPISGAVVTVNRSSVDGPLTVAESYLTTTASDGTFSVPGLTAGPFTICATALGTNLLNACEWSDVIGSPSVIRVPDGSGAVTATAKLQPGATLTILMAGPASIPKTAITNPAAAPLLQLGVWTNSGFFHVAGVSSSDSTSQTYSLLIPPNVDVSFAILAQNLTVTDTSGAPVDSTYRLTINLPAGGSQQLNYTVAAVAAQSNKTP